MKQQTAFITGSSSSIGKMIIAELSAQGWVVISPTHQELDLANLEEVKKYGIRLSEYRVDTFIHVAGVWHDKKAALANKPFDNFTPKEITRTINVTLTAPMLLFSAIAKSLTTVIGISGTFNNGAKGWLPYYTSKRALEDFLVGLNQDYEKLRVYGISPADTATEAYKKFYPQYINEAQSPENIAKLVLDIVEGNVSYKSGSIIEIRQGKTQIGFHV